jgi:AcrR family transcriptional regulator
MARPLSISDEQILAAARAVFLEKGISATTAEVARRAGCAEGSVFKRFSTKWELFHKAMEIDFADPAWLRHLEERVGRGPLRKTLVEVGLEIIDFFRRLVPLMAMAWSNPGPDGLPAHLSGPNPPPLRGIKRTAAFFEAEMRAGRLKRHDPEIVARTYLGALQNYAFLDVILKAGQELPLPAESYVRGLVRLLLHGAAPGGADPELQHF